MYRRRHKRSEKNNYQYRYAKNKRADFNRLNVRVGCLRHEFSFAANYTTAARNRRIIAPAMQIPPALVAGLGNPGGRYADTRHNAGFWFVEALAANIGATFTAKKTLHGDLAAAACRLFRPTTFMNDSGRAVAAATRYYRVPSAAVLVAHDEADLPAGKIKLKFAGSDAGHNGLADITQAIGGGYWRLRIGVGKPAIGDIADYVLSPPTPTEKEQITAAVQHALAVWETIQKGNWQTAMLALHTPPAAV